MNAKAEYCVQLWDKKRWVTYGRGERETLEGAKLWIAKIRERSSAALFLILRPRIVHEKPIWSSTDRARELLAGRGYEFSTLNRNYQAAITPRNFALRILNSIKRTSQ